MHQSVWGDAHHSLTQEVCLFTCERASEGPGSVWMNLSTDVKTGKSRRTSEPTSGASPHIFDFSLLFGSVVVLNRCTCPGASPLPVWQQLWTQKGKSGQM